MTLQLLAHEEERLLALLRAQLVIDWDRTRSHALPGGLSGAAITRLAFKWQNAPSTNQIFGHVPPSHPGLSPATAGVNSTVVKAGELATLAKEAAAYAQLPEQYQHYFGRIVSGPHYTNQAANAYLLLEDLAGYKTLQEALSTGNQYDLAAIVEQFNAFLQRVYAMPTSAAEPVDVIDPIYLAPICRSLHKLERYRPYLLGFDRTRSSIERQLVSLHQHNPLLNDFPRTVMHGDLHLRNIMVREVRPETGDLDFRLIDLEKFQPVGDVAYDIGELSMALANFCDNHCLSDSVQWISHIIEAAMAQAVRQRGDRFFLVRLELAKARSLLKLMELDLKRIIPDALPAHPQEQSSRSTFFIQLDLAQVQAHLGRALACIQECK